MEILLLAVVYNTSEKYGEVEVRKGQEKVRLNVRGEVNHVPYVLTYKQWWTELTVQDLLLFSCNFAHQSVCLS